MNKTDKKIKVVNQRNCSRQPVLLKAMLDTGCYEFECVAYDLSLKGIRLKLDLPLRQGSLVRVMVRQCPHISAQVVWVRNGFIGLEFSKTSEQVAEILGDLGSHLPKI